MSESIAVQCSHCGQKLAAPPKLAGRRVACPKCKAPVDVPAPLPVAEVVEELPNLAFLDELSAGPAIGGPPPLPVAAPLAAATAWPSRRPTGRGNRKNVIAFVAIIAGCCLAGGGFVAYMLMGGGVGSDLRYLPDNCDFVMTFDIHRILASTVGSNLKANAAATFQQIEQKMREPGDNMTLDDFGRFTLGAKLDGVFTGIAHFNRPLGDDEFTGPNAKGAKKQVGSYQVIVRNGMAFCKIDRYTMAVGNEAWLTTVLNRGGDATLAPDLTAAMAAVDFSAPAAIAYLGSSLQKMPGLANGASTFGGPDGIRGAALQVDVDSEIRLRAVALCKDDNVADQLKKMADGSLAMLKMNSALPPATTKILNSVTVSNSGSTVNGGLTIDSDTVNSLMSLIPLAGGLPGGKASPFAGGNSVPPMRSPMTPTAPIAPRAPAAKLPNSSFGPPKVGASGGNVAETGWRAQSTNNLKQIGLGLLNAESKDGHFPPPAICDDSGKPLLSWRVAILPYLHEEQLYKQFDLTQPWDSPKNKRLLIRMPRVYRVPGGKVHGIGNTCYLAPVGENAAFFGTQGRKTSEFQRGTSRTYFVVEAAPDRAVPWTKPADLPVNESNPADGLFGQRDGGCLVLFADSHVLFVPQETSADSLRANFHLVGDTPP